MREEHLSVPRTARYHTLGDPARATSTWILLHGYGHLARYFLRKFEGLEKDRYLVAPEGLSRFYLDEGHTRVGATWMTREDREHEIADQLTYLDALAAHVARTAPRAGSPGVLGFSQGVATASRWAALGNTKIPRLILWGGSFPPDIALPQLTERLSSCRIDLVHGERDTIVPEAVMVHTAARLREAGIRSTSHIHPGGHELDRLMLDELLSDRTGDR